jgi:hypothetical protein
MSRISVLPNRQQPSLEKDFVTLNLTWLKPGGSESAGVLPLRGPRLRYDIHGLG